jgi:predicted small secreted protein
MKKWIALLLAVGVVCVSLSGCNSGTTKETKTGGPGGGSTTKAETKP